MTYKKHFVSFADSRMQPSLYRIQQQAQAMTCYDYISIFNEKDLDPSFVAQFKKELVKGTRGFGYWCWKPQVILQELKKMNEGDVLEYTDAGCHLNPKGKKRLIEYFDIAHRDGILGFQSRALNATPDNFRGHFFPDYQWTKGDVLDYFNVRNRKDILESGTIGATIIFIKKCPDSINIVQQWLKAYQDDFSLATDVPSRMPNIEGFIENRHDQALWSILCKLNKVKTESACEHYPSAVFAPVGSDKSNYSGEDWSMFEHYPILSKRDRNSVVNLSIQDRYIKRPLRTIKKITLKFISIFIPIGARGIK